MSRRDTARLTLLRLAAKTLEPAIAPQRSPPRRVLLVRPDHIGDVLLTAPAVALLRASLPEAYLTYLVGPWSVEAARRGPSVDEVRSLAFPGFTRRRNPNLLQPYALLLREAARLRREQYDLTLVFRPDHWWGALLALVAGTPLRVGTATPETTPLLSHPRPKSDSEHAAETALGLALLAIDVAGAQAPNREAARDTQQFRVTDSARHAATDLVRRLGLDPARRLIAIQPGAGAPLKSWPVANWANLADTILGERRAAVLLTGARDDQPLLAAISAHAQQPMPVASGQPLEVTAAIYERCAVVISLDSAAGHLAAAVGTPTVRLYGPAPASVFGPWPPRADQRVLVASFLNCVPCGSLESPPCHATHLPACMLALDVDVVMKAVRAQLDRG